MNDQDIMRHPLVKKIVNAYEIIIIFHFHLSI